MFQDSRVLDSLEKTSVLHISWGVKQCVHQRAPLGVNRCPTKKVFIATRLTNITNLSLKCGAVSKASCIHVHQLDCYAAPSWRLVVLQCWFAYKL